MAQPLNLPSFRISFESQLAALPIEAQEAHRTTFNALTDLYQAISALNGKVEGVKSSIAASTATNVTTASEEIIQVLSNVVGFVNLQPSVTTYNTVQSDYGKLIVFNDASPIAVTLNTAGSNPGIQLPFFCSIYNAGAGSITTTPASGTINGGASVNIGSGDFAIIYYDGTNFEALIPASSGSGVTQIVAGTNVTISPSGGTGTVTVNATGAAYTVNLSGTTLSPGSATTGTTAHTAPSTAVLMCSLYDPTSPGANEFLSAYAYNQNGTISWSVMNVSNAPVTVLSSTVLNIRVLD